MATSLTKSIRGLARLVRQTATQLRILAQEQDILRPAKKLRNIELYRRVREEISNRKRAERRLSMQYAVSQVLVEAANLDAAAPQLLQAIGENLGWKLGIFWMVNQQATVLRCSAVWKAPSVTATEFQAASEQKTLPANMGLPGRAWASGAPAWITDILKDNNFPWFKAATKDGLRGAFAFPVQGPSGFLGVIEFYSHKIQPPDKELIRTVATLGNQIGQFMERKQAEKALRMSEGPLRLLAEQDWAVIYHYRMVPTPGFEYISPASTTMGGYAPEEYYTDPDLLFKTIHPDDRPMLEDAMQSASVASLESRWIHKNGSVVWVEQRSVLIHDECGTVVAVAGIVHDITQRKRAEEALRESEARSRAILETALDGIITIDHEERIIEWNAAAEQMFGYSRDKALGHKMSELVIPPAMREQKRRGLAHYLATGESRVLDHRIEMNALRADGTEFSVELTVNRIPTNGPPMFTSFVRDITDRQRTEKALRESEERFRVLFEQSPDGILLFDPHDREVLWRIVDCNSTESGMTGYPHEELIGQGIQLLSTGQPNPEGCAAYVERMRREGPVHGETVHRRKDGSLFPIEFSTSVINVGGRELVLGIDRNISERKHAEEALRASEERFRVTFEQAAVGIAHLGLDGRWVQVNQRLCDILGYSREELRTLTFQQVTYPDDLSKELAFVQAVLAGDIQTYAMEKRYIHKDGSIVWANLTGSLLREPTGAPTYFVTIVEDIMERKRAAEALRQSQERYRAVVEQSLEGIFLVDADTKQFLEANAAYQHLIGYSAEELLDLTLYDVVAHDHASIDWHVQRIVAEQRHGIGERRHRRKDGQLVDVDVRANMITYDGKRALCVILHDITERKRTENMLRRYTQRLESLLKIDQTILTTQSSEVIAQVGLKYMCQLVDCYGGCVVLYTPESNQATVIASCVNGEIVTTQAPHVSLESIWYLDMLRQGKAHNVRDVVPGVGIPPAFQTLQPERLRAYVNVPFRLGNDLIGSLDLVADRPDAFGSRHIDVIREVANHLAIGIREVHLFEEVRDARERLEMLSRRLLATQENERRHIARELHDEIGQLLTGLKLILEMSSRLPHDQVGDALNEAKTLVTELMGRVRALSLELRPAMLDDLGLLPALLWHFERYTAQTGVRVLLSHRGLEDRFALDVETAAYRIIQEALTNVARYAGVREVVVGLCANAGTLEVEIKDHGAGFDSWAALSANATSGLTGMHERAALLGGQLTIEAERGGGTRVWAKLPLNFTWSEGRKDAV